MANDLSGSGRPRWPPVPAKVRAIGVYLALILALTLTACGGTVPEKPAPQAVRANQAGESEALSEVIYVVPPSGAPTQTGLVLADAIAAEIRDHDRPAILAHEPNQAGASVVGQVVSAEPHGAVVWLTIEWAVRAPFGTYVEAYEQRVVIDQLLWQQASPEVINLVISDAAPEIVRMVEANVGPPTRVAMTHPTTEPKPVPAQPPPKPTAASAPSAGPATAPPPASAPATGVESTEPLARISEETNGQVVLAPGMPAPDEAPPRAAPQQEIPPPSELPSLLTPPAGQAAASSGPRALTPGAADEVAPPPGGTGGTNPGQAADTEEDEGILSALTPNMESETRRPGDARPDPAGARFAQVRWGQPSFLIRPVEGAPGNGNQALTAGLKTALRGRDVTISEDPRQAGFVIDGNVDMGEPVNGRQYVRIIWRVATVAGDEVGKAVQENTVVAGSLNGEWGRVAEAVSQAAVRGIQDLFGDAEETLGTREQLPDFPDVNLPEEPGRAPPPPVGG